VHGAVQSAMTRLGLAALAAALVVAPTAAADGLPVLGIDVGPQGVTVPAVATRHVALPAGPRETLVARVMQEGGQVVASRVLRGRFTIPAVAYDGSAGGLSADARTLVLVRPRVAFPQRRTTFALLDARRLRVRDVVTLHGDFSFDAISPKGRWLYLVEYLSPRDPTRYLVRLYDLPARRLLREPVIDPREVGDVMRGSPVSRAASPDGRFAYTLYDGAGDHPFIHALDTERRTARCIDLHAFMGRDDLFDLRLAVGPGGTITVSHVADGATLLLVDARTGRVWEPAEAATPRAAPPAPAQGAAADRERDDGVPWGTLAAPLLAGVLVAAAVSVALLRRRVAAT
jgi:hypothetical protein